MSAVSQSERQVRPPPLPSGSNLARKSAMEKNKKVVFWFGVIEITLGLLSCAIGIVSLGKHTHSRHYYHDTLSYSDWYFDDTEENTGVDLGQGIWCGLFFIVYGVVGVSIRFKTTPCLYMVNLVMSFLGAILMITLTVLSSISVSATSLDRNRFFAWNVILTVIGISGTIISTMHALFCNVKKSNRRRPEGSVVYTAVRQQATTMIPVQMPNGQVLCYPPQPFYPMPMNSINCQYSLVPMPNANQTVFPTHPNFNPTGNINVPYSSNVPSPPVTLSSPQAGSYFNSHPGQVLPPPVVPTMKSSALQPSQAQANPSTNAFSDRPPSYSEFDIGNKDI